MIPLFAGWNQPTRTLLFVGIVALLARAALVRPPPSALWLVAEVFAVTLAVSAVVGPGWRLLWLVEHRW